MRLRYHSQMKWRGEPNWPPHWGGVYERGTIRPEGEEGILETVEVRGPDHKSSCCLNLTMRYQNADYHATLHFDNLDFIPWLFEKLRACKGLTIWQVGDIEIA